MSILLIRIMWWHLNLKTIWNKEECANGKSIGIFPWSVANISLQHAWLHSLLAFPFLFLSSIDEEGLLILSTGWTGSNKHRIVISWACMGIEFQQWPEESSNIQNFEVWWNFWRLSSNWMWVNVRYWRLLHHGYTWHAPGVVSQRTSWNTECARQFQQSSILCRAAVMFWQLVATLRSCSKLVQTAWGLDSRCLPPAGSRATNLGKATVSHWNQQHVFRFVPRVGGQSPTKHPIGVNLGVTTMKDDSFDGVINVSHDLCSHLQKGDVICSKSLDLRYFHEV